ncbi:MAG: hypothetical protein DRP96_10570 [Candidatus Neomarinimicrobiota bacterium]|nr:MAG: hypothetical protein DRP96_10570 [Candidatus Neomarinimicrobiota bacterium]
MNHEEKILCTGSNGLLGTEFKKIIPKAIFTDVEEFNICKYEMMSDYISNKKIKKIIHAAAFTSPPKIDKEPIKAIDVNIIGTSNVVKLCAENQIDLIYISTDYVFDGSKGNYSEEDPVHPVNKYAWSKLGGECAVRLYDKSLIIRTSFGPNIFPFEKAFVDQFTSRESVESIAGKIIKIIDKEIYGVVHIGGKRRTVMEYAKALNPKKTILPLKREDVTFIVPKDTSLNISKYNNIVSSDIEKQ